MAPKSLPLPTHAFPKELRRSLACMGDYVCAAEPGWRMAVTVVEREDLALRKRCLGLLLAADRDRPELDGAAFRYSLTNRNAVTPRSS